MAVPPPPLKGSLSAILNSAAEAPDALDTRGRRLYWGHRRLLSHRRLWLAVAALPVLFYLGWQAHSARQLTQQVKTQPLLAAAQAGLRGTYLLIALVGFAAALGVGTAALNARLSHYAVYERQIESCTGVFFRRRRVVWLFETTEVQFEQRPHHLLAGSATLVFYTGQTALTGLKTNRLWGARRPAELNGFGSATFLRRLHDLLLNTIVQERYSMKRQFI